MTAVRPATPTDARAIADVHVATWRAAYTHAFPAEVLDSLSVDEREQMWRRATANDAISVYVAETNEIVGFVSVGPSSQAEAEDEGEGELYAIYVRPDSWGSGAGAALMEAARARLAERFSTAILWVLEDNPARDGSTSEKAGWWTVTAPTSSMASRCRKSGTGCPA